MEKKKEKKREKGKDYPAVALSEYFWVSIPLKKTSQSSPVFETRNFVSDISAVGFPLCHQ
jgi:hypothetical protein